MPGSQTEFLRCPVKEVLYEGTRGPGKTDALLMAFAQHIGKWGMDWVGVIFRRTYKELDDIISKSRKWFRQMFPQAKYNKNEHYWEWSTGERLLFRHFRVPSDYDDYHGHAYPFIGWEELTKWPSPDCYLSMMSTCRSTNPNVPNMIRSTTNPDGVGHNWVKARWKLPITEGQIRGPVIRNDVMMKRGEVVLDRNGDPVTLPDRVAIHGSLKENFLLLDGDPGYMPMLYASAKNEAQLKAWVEGDWNIVSGGMFDDLWDDGVHEVPDFTVPASWRIDRSFDWGASKPFSVGFWAESDGTDLTFPDGTTRSTVAGDVFRIAEWYGWTGKENEGLNLTDVEIARGVLKRQESWFPNRTVHPGPADSAIFDVVQGYSTAKAMSELGCTWTKADKKPGSRRNGWQRIRDRLQAAISQPGVPRERPGLYVCRSCDQFIRTFPVLPRSEKDPDDVDTEAEDHIGDESRYRVYSSTGRLITQVIGGR